MYHDTHDASTVVKSTMIFGPRTTGEGGARLATLEVLRYFSEMHKYVMRYASIEEKTKQKQKSEVFRASNKLRYLNVSMHSSK